MIAGADILFQDLPIDFGDPVSLAGSHAPGRLSLIVAGYPEGEAGPVYDACVCKAPAVLAVAHVTPDFKFPIPLSRAMARYYEARERELPGALSLYELDWPLAALFLESVYFHPSLKLRVTGDTDQDFIARQIEQLHCADGILECSDFTDPQHPTLMFYPFEHTQASFDWPAEISESTPGATRHILLYDRQKNQAVARDRGAATLDVDFVLQQGAHYASLVRQHSAHVFYMASELQEAWAEKDSREALAVEEHLRRHPQDFQTDRERRLIQEMASLLSGDSAGMLDDASAPANGEATHAAVGIEVDHPAAEQHAGSLQPQTAGDPGELRRNILAELRKIYTAVLNELST